MCAELDVRPDAGGDDDEVGVEHVPSASATPSTWPLPRMAVVRAAEQHADAEVLHLAEQVAAAVGIELPLHQRRHQVDDGDVAALHLQPARGLETEQAAADDDGLARRARALEQRARVVERAEGEDAVLVEARRSAA